jgi:chemotaxis protein CheZ
MSQPDPLNDRYRPFVDAMQSALDAGDEAAFRSSFEGLRGGLNAELNPELKRITASAQDALRRFREDARLEVLADQEVPDARRRLSHVVKLTEEAAHRTLELVEQSSPLVARMALESAQLLEEWELHGSRQLAVATMWPERVQETLERSMRDTDRLRRYLSQMLLAQGYQDLSGQIINAVIKLASELETVLGELVTLASGAELRPRLESILDKTGELAALRRGVGPHVPGTGTGTGAVVNDQDDIDALLASLEGGS